MSDEARADWPGVGASFRTLGKALRERAVDAGGAISASSEQEVGAVDQVSAVFRTAIAKLDETVTDPEVGAATRNATARLLDAIKAELTGEGAIPPAPPDQAGRPDDQGPPAQLGQG